MTDSAIAAAGEDDGTEDVSSDSSSFSAIDSTVVGGDADASSVIGVVGVELVDNGVFALVVAVVVVVVMVGTSSLVVVDGDVVVVG